MMVAARMASKTSRPLPSSGAFSNVLKGDSIKWCASTIALYRTVTLMYYTSIPRSLRILRNCGMTGPASRNKTVCHNGLRWTYHRDKALAQTKTTTAKIQNHRHLIIQKPWGNKNFGNTWKHMF